MNQEIKNRLNKYDINFNQFSKYTGLTNFEIPKKLKRIYGSSLSSEECFYLISYVVFGQCDLLTGQKATFLEQENYELWAEKVGEKRAENFKLAVFEEVKFRIFSNSFPEFSNEQSLINPIFSVRGEAKEYKIIAQILSPQAANYIINSHWNLLDFEGATDYIKNFQEYLDKFVYKPFYRDLGALRALMIAKEMMLKGEIGEVMNYVSRHYAEFIFTKDIQQSFNTKINEQLEQLSNLLNAKELTLLGKIGDVKEEVKTEINKVASNLAKTNKRVLNLEELDLSTFKNNTETKIVKLEEKINEIPTNITSYNFDSWINEYTTITEDINNHPEINYELSEDIKKAWVSLLNKKLFNPDLERIDRERREKIEALENELRELKSTISSSSNNVEIPSDILTKANLNSEKRELSGLTITPGNGINNSSLFLKNSKAHWEFFADVYSGSFGVWDKLKNRSALNINTSNQVDFYGNLNIRGNKISNLGDPSGEKDAVNKKYVDAIKNTLTGSLNTAKSELTTNINEVKKEVATLKTQSTSPTTFNITKLATLKPNGNNNILYRLDINRELEPNSKIVIRVEATEEYLLDITSNLIILSTFNERKRTRLKIDAAIGPVPSGIIDGYYSFNLNYDPNYGSTGNKSILISFSSGEYHELFGGNWNIIDRSTYPDTIELLKIKG